MTSNGVKSSTKDFEGDQRGEQKGRSKGRGYKKGHWDRKVTMTIPHDPNGSVLLNAEPHLSGNQPTKKLSDAEVMRRRRERFANDSKKQDDVFDFGLISRGDDMRLKNDENARKMLLEKTLLAVKDYEESLPNPNSAAKRDKILMSFRKLRECVVALEETANKANDLEFYKKVYLSSLKFSLNSGHIQSYIATQGYIIHQISKWNCSDTEIIWMNASYALHLACFEKDYEKALNVINKNMLQNSDQHTTCHKNPSICINQMIIADILHAPRSWLMHYNHNTQFLSQCGGANYVLTHKDELVAQIEKSYRGNSKSDVLQYYL